MNYWLAVGSPKNWKTAFDHGKIWGLKRSQKHLWESLRENDAVLFYATHPVRGIVGHGLIRTKFKQNQPLWPDEVKQNKVIWPLRFELDVKSCLPQEEWESKKLTSKAVWPRAGFQPLDVEIGEQLASSLGADEYTIETFEPLMVKEPTAEYVGTTKEMIKAPSSHDDIKETLVQIGRLQGYLAEPEYAFDIGKLDVVWRRVLNSVPTYVFEIQVAGDVYHALAKLKHAFDLWNSHIYIVASEKERIKVESLLSGTFHEIDSRIKFIELQQIKDLYERKRSYLDFERELGIGI